MKRTRIQIILFALIVLYSSAAHSTDLNELYHSNYDKFWSEYHELQNRAIACKDYTYMTTFLSNAIVLLGNAEVSEANAETIEKLVLNNTICLLESLQNLNSEEKTKIIRFFLIAPIFNDEKVIHKALVKQLDKYREIKKLYDELKTNS